MDGWADDFNELLALLQSIKLCHESSTMAGVNWSTRVPMKVNENFSPNESLACDC